MKAFFNKFRTESLSLIMTVLISSLTSLSCNKDELEIQNNFPFEVKVMPVPAAIANGDTVEIRLTLKPAGNYAGTQYFLRYFQFDGQGTLSYYNDPPYLPNNLYAITAGQFRLYYTSKSTVSQSFQIWISDNFGNEKQLEFEFNNSD